MNTKLSHFLLRGGNNKLNIIIMEDTDNYYNEEETTTRIPNDGREELDIEPLDWDDM